MYKSEFICFPAHVHIWKSNQALKVMGQAAANEPSYIYLNKDMETGS